MDYFRKFLSLPAEKTLKEYRSRGDAYWKKTGEKMALELFRQTAQRVPAYKKFLKKNKINPKTIKTIKDFKNIPLTDKDNYINKYKLSELCWDGKIENSYFLSASSGSTGIPNFWPRSPEQTFQGASISELIYREYFECDKKSTLYIVAFAMGMWIAGTYMAMSTEWVSQKGYPITVVTPGTNKEEILRLIKMGTENYKQIILIGYPPFVKDVVDFGIEKGVDWKNIKIKFMFSGEAISERWREHLASKTNFGNILTGSINIYGSADVGLIAHETAVTTYLRRKAFEDKNVLKDLYHSERVPSVNQFDPRLRYFEKVGEHLIVTAPSGLPLVRYDTKDEGGVMYFDVAKSILRERGVDVEDDFRKMKISRLLWRTPMVYLFGRGKFTTTIYVANVYPENVKLVLEHESIEKDVTGKFVIYTVEKKDHTPQMVLRVELAEGRQKGNLVLAEKIRKVFVSEVASVNSEYKYVLDNFKDKVHPKVILHEYGDPEYFPRGVVKKSA